MAPAIPRHGNVSGVEGLRAQASCMKPNSSFLEVQRTTAEKWEVPCMMPAESDGKFRPYSTETCSKHSERLTLPANEIGLTYRKTVSAGRKWQ